MSTGIIVSPLSDEEPVIEFPYSITPNEPATFSFTIRFGSNTHWALDEDMKPQLFCFLDGVFLEATEENRPTSGVYPGESWYTFDNVSHETVLL